MGMPERSVLLPGLANTSQGQPETSSFVTGSNLFQQGRHEKGTLSRRIQRGLKGAFVAVARARGETV